MKILVTVALVLLAVLGLLEVAIPMEKLVSVGTMPFACPGGLLVAEGFALADDPDEDVKQVTIKDEKGLLAVGIFADNQPTLLGVSIMEWGELVYYSREAFMAKYPDTCSMTEIRKTAGERE